MTARTSKANKTNYSKMSVVLVYWGCALREPLQSVFHATRTLRWINTHEGWDFPIEQLNNWSNYRRGSGCCSPSAAKDTFPDCNRWRQPRLSPLCLPTAHIHAPRKQGWWTNVSTPQGGH